MNWIYNNGEETNSLWSKTAGTENAPFCALVAKRRSKTPSYFLIHALKKKSRLFKQLEMLRLASKLVLKSSANTIGMRTLMLELRCKMRKRPRWMSSGKTSRCRWTPLKRNSGWRTRPTSPGKRNGTTRWNSNKMGTWGSMAVILILLKSGKTHHKGPYKTSPPMPMIWSRKPLQKKLMKAINSSLWLQWWCKSCQCRWRNPAWASLMVNPWCCNLHRIWPHSSQKARSPSTSVKPNSSQLKMSDLRCKRRALRKEFHQMKIRILKSQSAK